MGEPLESKLERYNKMLEGFREKYKSDPANRAVYKAQGMAIKIAIELVQRKLNGKQRKLV